MALGNYSIFKPKHVDAIKFGSTEWTDAEMAQGTAALDTTFSANNSSVLLDVAGDADANNPTKSYPFAQNIRYSGNERSYTEVNLLGSNTSGTQNQELSEENTTQQEVTMTLVYRNNIPFSLFNDTTTCCLMSLDNEEGSTTGIANFAFNNIHITHVGSIEINDSGIMTQQLKFTHIGGTTGTSISVTQASPSETWQRYVGGDYAEEVRLT